MESNKYVAMNIIKMQIHSVLIVFVSELKVIKEIDRIHLPSSAFEQREKEGYLVFRKAVEGL